MAIDWFWFLFSMENEIEKGPCAKGYSLDTFTHYSLAHRS